MEDTSLFEFFLVTTGLMEFYHDTVSVTDEVCYSSVGLLVFVTYIFTGILL